MLARPGFFPDIDYVAEKLGMSTRTLRRRLKEEGSNYRALLDEIRFGLAKEYLGETNLPMEEICGLLGYSESGNFSHAFRRWSGQSPRDWRQGAGFQACGFECPMISNICCSFRVRWAVLRRDKV